MKKHLVAIALAAAALAPAVARADDPKLPFNPFEKAQKGDWCVLTGTFRREGASEPKVSASTYARVMKVDGDKVTVAEAAQVGAVENASKTFSTKNAPTVIEFFDLKEGKIEGFKVEDDKRKVC